VQYSNTSKRRWYTINWKPKSKKEDHVKNWYFPVSKYFASFLGFQILTKSEYNL
jgi:hypothetical protein